MNERQYAYVLKTRKLPSFAGVALADILANGVALLIILVVISLSIRQEQDQLKLEQSREVAALLSRDLASSVVMNALPTSRPAILHDYETAEIDQNPTHSRMPILQMDGSGLRDYYTGKRFPTSELLKPDNDLDRYLSTLNPLQKERIRLDIYGIEPFYLVMSIFKDHLIRIRHWHFLESQLVESAPDLSDQKRRMSTTPLEAQPPELEDEQSGLSLDELVGRANFKGLAQVNPFPSLEDLLEQRPQGSGEQQNSQSDQQQSGRPNHLTLRIPTHQQENSEVGEGNLKIPLEVMLAAMYQLIVHMQERIDAGDHLVLEELDLNAALASALKGSLNEDSIARFKLLASGIRQTSESLMPLLVTENASKKSTNSVVLSRNQPLSGVEFRYASQIEIQKEVTLSLNLSLYPSTYKGVRMRLGQGAVILMPSDPSEKEKGDRWRLGLVVEPVKGDMMLGLLYANTDQKGLVELDADINNISLENRSVHTRYKRDKTRQYALILIISLIVFLSLIAFMLRRYFR